MQNQYRPFYEIEFNFTTSLSKDDAVLAMLGWIKKPYREVSEAETDYQFRVDSGHPVSEEDELRFAPYSPSLFDVLREIKESADSEYANTKIEDPLDEETLAENLANIKKSHELIETAHRFYCDIDDELAKGERSELRLDQRATKDPYITLMSLAKWASKAYDITLFKLTKPVTFEDLGDAQQAIIESLEGHSEDTTQLQITFALLVEAFSKTANTFKKSDGSPNASAIASVLELQIKIREDFTGLSKRNFQGYISSALQKKKGLDNQKHSITSKTLNICLALLVEAFAGKKDQFQDEKSKPDVQGIAEHLASQAVDLAEQTQAQIQSRIIEALEIKINPDRRPSP